MRIHIYSTGASLGLAYHFNLEGHTVYSTQEATPLVFVHTPDISIFDAVCDPVVVATLRKRGTKVIGVDSWIRLLETDVHYKHAFLRALDYTMPELQTTGDRVTVACLFNGNQYISKTIIFPYHRMMAQNVGVELECSGYLAYFDTARSKLVDDILTPLERFLRKAAHKGFFSVDCIVNKDGVFVEDVSASMSKAYMTAIFENTRLSKTEVLLKIFDETTQKIPYVEAWAAGVLISIAPYPYLVPDPPEKVEGFNPLNLKHLWLVDVSQDGDVWLCGRHSGCLGYVTSRGLSIQEVMRRTYRTLQNIHVENIQYRNDIGKDVYDRFARLKDLQLV